jgi:hypothetical protein
MYESKFDVNIGFESKELNLSKPVLIQLNKILSKFNGGLNILDPIQPLNENQEYQDYTEFLVNNATLSEVLKRHLKYNLVSILQLLDKEMEGNTNLHNETEKLKKQVNDTNAAVEQLLAEKQDLVLEKNQLTREWKTAIEDNNNLGVKVKQPENEKKQWSIEKNQYEKDLGTTKRTT